MNLRTYAAPIAVVTLALTACQGSFSNGGTTTPGMPPNPVNGTGSSAAANAKAATSPTPSNGTYPFSQASTGFTCPEVQGFSCVLRFNIPLATPTPVPTASHGKSKKLAAKPKRTPVPSPSPTPSPSPQPSASDAVASESATPSDSASPSASDSPEANVTIKLDPLPKDAPPMTNPDPSAVATTPLLALRMSVDGDVTLDGAASADFTLPKEQIGGRGFAIQLFAETQGKHHRVSDRYLGSYSQSTLDGTTLHFSFVPPTVTVKKGETWLFVLYGDERPSVSTSPGEGSAAPSTSPAAGESSAPAPSASAQR